jgi:UDP-glucose 4-epimerase
MRVLITGSDGFVGHHIANAFLAAGWSVLGVDDHQAKANLTPPKVEWLRLNLQSLMSSHLTDVDFVVHAAARADVSLNWERRSERDHIWRENIDGTVNLLEMMPEVPVVFLSTGAVYGDTPKGFEEEHQRATSPYAASKLAGEALVEAYAFKRRKPYWCLRLGCVVGGGYHHGHIRDMVLAARAGHFHARNEGRTRKSFVHVADVAATALKLATAYASVTANAANGIYNLQNGGWSWRDTLVQMRRTEPDAEFGVTSDEQLHGWVGDPMAVLDSGKSNRAGIHMRHEIDSGVRDALRSLGWGTK